MGERLVVVEVVHGAEMARAITAKTFLNAMQEAGLGGWLEDAPSGWSQVGTLTAGTRKFYAPDGIAKGLRAVTDPNYLRFIDSLRGLERYQALVKTVDLSFSLFHHISLLAATLNEGLYGTLLDLPWVEQKMAEPEWRALEQDAAEHQVMTDAVQPNMDYARNLTQGGKGLEAQVRNAPGVKQGLELANRNAKFLFGKWARYMKVNSYGRLAANWIADNPAATDEELRAAKMDIARHVNAVFGGQNWEAMGLPKAETSVMRLSLLAPDWFTSNAQFMMQIFERGQAGAATRMHAVRAAGYGTAALYGLNYAFTGHGPEENAPGHKFEAEVAPRVYFSPFRGGPGEALKLASMIVESGPRAPGRYAQAKGSPLTRLASGFLSGVKYNGQPIIPKRVASEAHINEETGRVVHTEPITNAKAALDLAAWAFGAAGPVPFGVSGLHDYIKSGEATPIGILAVGSGLGRYSPGPKKKKGEE